MSYVAIIRNVPPTCTEADISGHIVNEMKELDVSCDSLLTCWFEEGKAFLQFESEEECQRLLWLDGTIYMDYSLDICLEERSSFKGDENDPVFNSPPKKLGRKTSTPNKTRTLSTPSRGLNFSQCSVSAIDTSGLHEPSVSDTEQSGPSSSSGMVPSGMNDKCKWTVQAEECFVGIMVDECNRNLKPGLGRMTIKAWERLALIMQSKGFTFKASDLQDMRKLLNDRFIQRKRTNTLLNWNLFRKMCFIRGEAVSVYQGDGAAATSASSSGAAASSALSSQHSASAVLSSQPANQTSKKCTSKERHVEEVGGNNGSDEDSDIDDDVSDVIPQVQFVEGKKWQAPETYKLIEEWGRRLPKFKAANRHSSLWKEISVCLILDSHVYSPRQCKGRIGHLTDKFNKTFDAEMSSGSGKIQKPTFYDAMFVYLKDSHKVRPPVSISVGSTSQTRNYGEKVGNTNERFCKRRPSQSHQSQSRVEEQPKGKNHFYSKVLQSLDNITDLYRRRNLMLELSLNLEMPPDEN